MSQPCPCGRLNASGQAMDLTHCCGRYLNQDTPAPDAQSLMRSRYSAFVLDCPAYLQATWHVSTRPVDLSLDPVVKWLGLEVRSHRLIDADHAEVEFVARSRRAGRATRLHETSRFLREAGRWYYVDGDVR